MADAPTNPAQFLKVDEIGFTVVALEDPEKAQIQWKDFMAALEKVTGKKVKYLADISTIDEQVQAGHFPSAQAAVETAVEQMMLDHGVLDDATVAAIANADAQYERGDFVEWRDVREKLRQKYLGK